MSLPCPLCDDTGSNQRVEGNDDRAYLLCTTCALIFAHPRHHLSASEEKARYDTHENSVEDEGYVRFLRQVLDPALVFLDPKMRALDYGSGPGPTLSTLIRREGMACDDYDPIYGPSQVNPPYDVIFSTECLEHFHTPAKELRRIRELLVPHGILALMTQFWTTLEAFHGWGYTRDDTHVAFYHRDTIDAICVRFGFDMLWTDDRCVAILRKQSP